MKSNKSDAKVHPVYEIEHVNDIINELDKVWGKSE